MNRLESYLFSVFRDLCPSFDGGVAAICII